MCADDITPAVVIRSAVWPRAQRPGADGLSPWPRKGLAVVAGVVSWAELNWAAPRRIHTHEAIPAPIEDVERVVPAPGSIVVVDPFTTASRVITGYILISVIVLR
eukprot:COSAG01_NODE_15796_length_1299_cov_0.648333_2_plen_105_part_00